MTDTITLDAPTSSEAPVTTEPTTLEPTAEAPVTVLPSGVAKGVKGPEKRAPKAKAKLPDVLTGPVVAPEPAAPTAAKAPINNHNRFFTVRFVAAGSKLDLEAKVTFNDLTAGDRFNGEKNKARFRVGVASGKTTVGELLKLEGGPTSGDLRHWCEHSSEAGGTPWIEIEGMKYLPPRK